LPRRPIAITYTGAVHPTRNVSVTYDPHFPRLTAMTDGTGTRPCACVPVGALGGLQRPPESGHSVGSHLTYGASTNATAAEASYWLWRPQPFVADAAT
jgi:hypothetical protein